MEDVSGEGAGNDTRGRVCSPKVPKDRGVVPREQLAIEFVDEMGHAHDGMKVSNSMRGSALTAAVFTRKLV